MNRSARLQAGRAWLAKYHGKKVASAYRKHFGLDWGCAFTELEMLGVKISADYKSQVLKSAAAQSAVRQSDKLGLAAGLFEQDENFAYIVGYTPAGFPYGLAWEKNQGA